MNSMKRNVILVGRHTPEGLPTDINIVEQKNILWSLDTNEIAKQWKELVQCARDKGCAILLQNVPGVLARVLLDEAWEYAPHATQYRVPVGVIISKPGERKAGVKKAFRFESTGDAAEAKSAVEFANSRAKTQYVQVQHDQNSISAYPAFEVTVDPVTPFVFVRIDWVM